MPLKDPVARSNYAKQYYAKNKKRIDLYRRKWASKNPSKERRYKSKWLKNNLAWYYEWERRRPPIIRKAYIAVRNAIMSGKIIQQPCKVCGSQKSHAHHPDYLKPLDVEWLCPKHHKERHKNEKSNDAAGRFNPAKT